MKLRKAFQKKCNYSCLSNSWFSFRKLAPKKKFEHKHKLTVQHSTTILGTYFEHKCYQNNLITGIMNNLTYFRAILSAYRMFSIWLLTLYTGLHSDGDQ